MAKNRMTPEQDLLTRQFFAEVSQDPSLFPDTPVTQRDLIRTLLYLLNYQVIDGKFVEKSKSVKRPYMGTAQVDCEWDADVRRAEEALNEGNSGSQDEADSGEPSTDTEVREAVLRQDV